MANDLRSVEGDPSHEWEGHLEVMLSGQSLPADGDPELRGVDELLAVLRASSVGPVELRGQAGVLEAYRETFAMSHPSPPLRRRPAMPSSLLRAKLAVALTAGAVSLGGLAAAAHTGALPDGLQDLAHATFGAPAVEHGKKAEAGKKADAGLSDGVDDKVEAGKTPDGIQGTPVGPDATGHAAFGLCTAWANVQAQSKMADPPIAFRNLATAAGGVNEITAYCATIPHPGLNAAVKTNNDPTGKPATAPGKPSSDLTGKPATAPGKPSSDLTGRPATAPGKPSSDLTGKPATAPGKPSTAVEPSPVVVRPGSAVVKPNSHSIGKPEEQVSP